MEKLLEKYKTKLENLKENRAKTLDTNTDAENHEFDFMIRQIAEICRDLQSLIDVKSRVKYLLPMKIGNTFMKRLLLI